MNLKVGIFECLYKRTFCEKEDNDKSDKREINCSEWKNKKLQLTSQRAKQENLSTNIKDIN